MKIAFMPDLGQGTSVVLCEGCIHAMLGAIEQELSRGAIDKCEALAELCYIDGMEDTRGDNNDYQK